MKAIILAAGRGKRLKELTEEKPKVMCEVDGKPMLEHTLKKLAKAGITEAIIIVHYKKEHIINYFGDEFDGIALTYAKQEEMKGTGDAVLTAEPYVDTDRFLVLAGDVVFEPDLIAKVTSHDSDGVITVCRVDDPSRFGVIEVDNGSVTRIVEKSADPPTNLANASVYVFPQAIFVACKKIPLSPRGEYEITDAIQMLIDDGYTFEYEVIDKWIDVGVKEQLEEAQALAKKLNLSPSNS